MRDRGFSTMGRFPPPTKNGQHTTGGYHSTLQNTINDDLRNAAIDSGDSITTIEPLESDDVSWEIRNNDEGRQDDYPSFISSQPPRNSGCWETSARRTLPPSPASYGHSLSWRTDPVASLSDWTIRVVVKDGDRTILSTLHHCHSTVLVWGPRKCDLFLDLFQQRMKMATPPRITTIEVSYTEAEVFPMLLDFLYCETTFALSAESVCSLYSLASTFKSEMLQTAIEAFVDHSLDFEQSIDFLSCGRRHPNREKIEKLTLSTNSRVCAYLVKDPTKASTVPPVILAHILHKRYQVLKVLKGGNPRKFSGEWELGRSRMLSSVVANCCLHASKRSDEGMTEEEKLSRSTFEQLINPKHLPALNCEASLSLLQVDMILSTQRRGGDVSSPTVLNSFERRCVDAIVADWTNILAQGQHATLLSTLSAVRASVLANILIEVSQQYERKVTDLDTPRTRDILENIPSNQNQNPDRPAQKEVDDLGEMKETPAKSDNQAQRTAKVRFFDDDADSRGSLSYSPDRYVVAQI